MSRYARKVDGNQSEIVSALCAIGVQVRDVSGAGKGLPDLICFYRGRVELVEVKNGSELTGAQVLFHAAARAAGYEVKVVNNPAEALALFGARQAA